MTEAEAPSFHTKKPLLSHLDELLKHARRSVFWIFIGASIAYLMSDRILAFLEAPVLRMGPGGPKIIITMPFEKFWVYVRVAMIAGIFGTMPFLASEISAFVGPGLKKIERRRIFWLVFSVYLAFLVGVVLGYLYVLPLILEAIMRYGSDREMALWTLSSYISTSIGILLVSALLLELPVIMVHLTSWGWVPLKVWTKGRRLAVVVNAVISAILAPPDVMSMILMMIPIQILYECGILLSRLVGAKAKEVST